MDNINLPQWLGDNFHSPNTSYKPITNTININLGDEVKFTAISEWDGARRMDTKILLAGKQLCFVSGEEYQEFLDKLQNLVNEYRI